MKEQAIADLRRSMSTLGQAEAELAWKKVSGKGITGINELVEAMRKEVRAFREAFIPDNAAFSSDEWVKIYREIDQAAARELSTAANKAISDLEAQKQALEVEIIKHQAAIEQSYRDFDRIKEKAPKLKADLVGYMNVKAEIANAESDYKKLFELRCKGRTVNSDAFFGLAELIVTRSLKLEVIEKLETETRAALADVKRRNNQLSKELGLQRHDI
jgi:hypothetical protein